ncbi:MAG: TonB-dependent receptor, partial [Chlorobi bacterium]|nr:TonB-dependent receptor [Chlorobiota bacterium]
DKSFGANSFYTSKFPWQYENTKTFFAGYKINKETKKYRVLFSSYWKRHQDRFELFREDKYKRKDGYFIDNQDTAKYYPNIYEDWNYYKGHNYHNTNLLSSNLKYDFKNLAGRTAIGAEYRYTCIKSNVLGEPMETAIDVPFEDFGEYTKSADRYNINFYVEHLFRYNKFLISAGASTNYNSNYDWDYTGGIDASYNFSKKLKVFASINQALRLPTFTDLYYDGPTNIGNPDLLPETAITYELGSKFKNNNLKANLTFFRRYGENTIDWVRLSDTIDWQAQNITKLTTTGSEFSVSYYFGKNNFLQKVSFSYAYTEVDKQSGEYISKYSLDYLKHKVVFSLHHKIYKNISASWIYRFEDRNGSFSEYNLATRTYIGEKEYEPISLIDFKIFWSNDFLEIFSEASNILNTEYYEFGNIKMPERWIKFGAKIKLNL